MYDDDQTPVEIPKGSRHTHSWVTINSSTDGMVLTDVVWCPCGVVFRRKKNFDTDETDFVEYRPGNMNALKLEDIIGEFGISCGGRQCGGCAACRHSKDPGGCYG
jgi:hypothetical protein